MDTGTNYDADEEVWTIENRPGKALLHEMIFLLRVYCHLKKELPESDSYLEAKAGIDTIRIMKDGKLMGMPDEKWDEPLDERLIAFDDKLDIVHNCLMMKYGYSERLNTIFYWTTEMKTRYFDAGIQRS